MQTLICCGDAKTDVLWYTVRKDKGGYSLFKTLILMCSEQLRDERTDQAIYHIFQGKKSIQTIQDTYLYQLEPYYRILPQLHNNYFTNTIQTLVHAELLESSNRFENSYTVTAKGKEVVANVTLPPIIRYLQGKKYSIIGELFEKRLLLLFQVVSNRQMKHRMYIPVIDDFAIMDDIKQLLHRMSGHNQVIAKQLYTEMTHVFSDVEDPYPTMFIDRLTGYQHYGKSMQLLAREYDMEEVDFQVVWKAIVHFLIEQCVKEKVAYPILSRLIETNKDHTLTSSAKQTKTLLTQGFTLEQIAQKRRLKLNTIHDHIVEITLQDPLFPIDPFIHKRQIKTILKRAYELNTYQLRTLKSSLGDEYSYFQIRLALARGGSTA